MARGTGRPLAALVLSDDERSFLEAQVRRHRVARSLSDRCRMILRCADGLGNKAVAAEIGVHEHTVGKWRRRFHQGPHRGAFGRAPSGTPAEHRGREGGGSDRADAHPRRLRTRRTGRCASMAKEAGLSHTSIWRIWGAFGLQPHRAETFKLSTDPHFVDKVRDIVGLYMPPPDRALVLCCRRKEPDPGARPHPARPADAAGHARAPHPRLQAQRNHLAVRRPSMSPPAPSSASAIAATGHGSSSTSSR